MLNNLFKLNGTPGQVLDSSQMPSMELEHIVDSFVFRDGSWEPLRKRIKSVKFVNSSFSRISMEKLTFQDCIFEDCLFLGTRFSEVQFHGCKFINCNFWKANFSQVYIDPRTIYFDPRYKIEAANAGVVMYQALLSNFSEDRQDKFFMFADINFRKWKRYQIKWELKNNRITKYEAKSKWMTSIIYQYIAGFGYNPLLFSTWTLIFFVIVTAINYVLIGNSVRIDGIEIPQSSFVDTLFYTFSILTVLGFSSIIPSSDGAKILTVTEAFIAVGWLGIFTSILVKRFLR